MIKKNQCKLYGVLKLNKVIYQGRCDVLHSLA